MSIVKKGNKLENNVFPPSNLGAGYLGKFYFSQPVVGSKLYRNTSKHSAFLRDYTGDTQLVPHGI